MKGEWNAGVYVFRLLVFSVQFFLRFPLRQLQRPAEPCPVGIAVGALADALLAQAGVVGYLVAGHLLRKEVDQQVAGIGTQLAAVVKDLHLAQAGDTADGGGDELI